MRAMVSLLLVLAPGLPAWSADKVVAFVGVNVIPMDRERVLTNQTVVVRNDRIAAFGPAASTPVPADASRVDGRGKYLMPGLAEMHGHIPAPNNPREFIDSVLFMYVANGVTTVRGMLGAPGQLDLRDRANKGEIVAPNLYLAGPSFSDASVNSPQEAVAKVREQKAAGWDLLKVHPGLTRDEYDAMARTAREAGMRFGGHVPAAVGLEHAIEAGQETFDHVDGYVEVLNGDKGPVNDARLKEIVQNTRAAGAWIVPTMALWETLQGALDLATVTAYPELKYMPPAQVRQWTAAHETRLKSPQQVATGRQVIQNRMRILKALHDGGVPILLGTDAPQQFSVPGFSIHREMQRMSAAGMKPFEILKSGTQNVGLYFKSKDKFGTIEAGSRADLVLLDANPLDDVANVARRSGVMVRGAWLAEPEIQAQLGRIAAMYQ